MSTGKKKWIGAAAAVALVVVGVVVFTSRDSGGASDKDLIITAAVKRQTLQDKVTLSGTLGRVEQRKVNAAAEGRISRTYLDDGVDVAPGQAILAIDGRDAGRRTRRVSLLPDSRRRRAGPLTSGSSSRSSRLPDTTPGRSTSSTPSKRASCSRNGKPSTATRERISEARRRSP